jgi:predicted hotdog family 3-hydroxylacyl-ACP dehydratase
MSLLDTILDYGDGWLQAEVHITPESTFADDQGVPAWIGMEYMAQAIAAYAGLQDRLKGEKPKIGLLLGSRKYLCTTDYFTFGQTLSLTVNLELEADNGLSVCKCVLKGQGVEASANLNVFKPANSEEFFREALK